MGGLSRPPLGLYAEKALASSVKGGFGLKKTLFLAYLGLFLAFFLPVAGQRAASAVPEAPTVPPAAAQTSPPEPVSEPAEAPAAPPVPRTIRVLREGTVVEMDLEDYLVGVVAAEMPASFPPEALKAQAVAARTYALYCAETGKHPDADVCTDHTHCQAWLDEPALREAWGADHEAWSEKIRQAVSDTAGQILRYEGQAVFAAFHASSPGATEDSAALWSALPYLPSVSSPETPETVPGLMSALDCAALDFRDVILSAFPQADLTGQPETWVTELRRDGAGRVAAGVIGGVEIPGTELRRLFSLRSTAFTLDYAEGRFTFTVAGSGHGVGMSQYGAKLLAEDGADYRQILDHYYPGTTLCQG